MLEGEAKLDSWRAERTGFPEVVFGPGKSAEQVAAIMRKMAGNEQVVMATRITPEARLALFQPIPKPNSPDVSSKVSSSDRVTTRAARIAPGARLQRRWTRSQARQHVHARPVEPACQAATQGRICL